MKLSNEILEKINTINVLLNNLTKFWSTIDISQYHGSEFGSIRVAIYTVIDERPAYFLRETVDLSDEYIENKLQSLIEQIKELIIQNSNTND